MALEGIVDWRGRPIDPKKHGGVRATLFLHFLVVMASMVNVGNSLNMVGYLHGTMHMSIANTSTTITNFTGAMSMFSLVGAFLSDAYIKRFYTILIFGPIDVLGYGLLAIQAHLASLRPPPCNPDILPNNCQELHGSNAAIFFVALYVANLGEGCMRACIASLGGDQFDSHDPVDVQRKSSWFNWYTFSIGVGVFIGVILIVWIENTKGWDVGFLASALIVLAGVLVVACGAPFYRNEKPNGSPLISVLQVFVAAYRKRKLVLPDNIEQQQIAVEVAIGNEVLPRTNDFKYLDKAFIEDGDKGPWSHCTVTQVEETKILLRMFPIFISSIFGYLPFGLLLPLTIQQGSTMDTRIGKIQISPANLFLIPVTFQILVLAIYDRLVVPFLRKLTGYTGGITYLQRVGIGFAFAMLSMVVAALIEMKRKKVAEEHGLIDVGVGVPMSVFWLSIQFFLLGILDVTSFVGLLEFFYSEVPRGMKSTGTSIFLCLMGLVSWVGSLVIQIANKVTRHGDAMDGWLDGRNLNKNHLDRFYWLLAIIGVLSCLNYWFWARRYVYRINPRIVAAKN